MFDDGEFAVAGRCINQAQVVLLVRPVESDQRGEEDGRFHWLFLHVCM